MTRNAGYRRRSCRRATRQLIIIPMEYIPAFPRHAFAIDRAERRPSTASRRRLTLLRGAAFPRITFLFSRFNVVHPRELRTPVFQDRQGIVSSHSNLVTSLIGRYVSGGAPYRYRCQCQQCTERRFTSLFSAEEKNLRALRTCAVTIGMYDLFADKLSRSAV